MGTFAELRHYGNSKKDESKKEEFSEKVKKVFQCGGMMDVESISLLGKKIVTLRKAEMNSKGMNFHYNYFEDDVWESAGYNREKNYVWSNKIVWSQFHDAVIAAYTLEEQYTEGVTATMVNGEFVTSWEYVGWLNYLFDENNHIKNFDTWSLFEAFHYSEDIEYYSEYERMWGEFGNKRYAFISMCEIYAVLYGIKEMVKKIEDVEKGKIEKLAFDSMKLTMDFLEKYEESFEECLENLNDRRYQALWRLFDKLIHDSELRTAADVIFVPEGPQHENEGVHYWSDGPKRRLIYSWDIMSSDKKHNKGRMTVRRYMALVANLRLQQKIFGF